MAVQPQSWPHLHSACDFPGGRKRAVRLADLRQRHGGLSRQPAAAQPDIAERRRHRSRRCGGAMAARLDGFLLGVVDRLRALRRHVHRAHLSRSHGPRIYPRRGARPVHHVLRLVRVRRRHRHRPGTERIGERSDRRCAAIAAALPHAGSDAEPRHGQLLLVPRAGAAADLCRDLGGQCDPDCEYDQCSGRR